MTRSGPLDAALALTRFGMGAKPGEIAAITPDPRGWLEAQARPGGAPVPAGELETSDQRVARYQAYLVEASEARRVRRDASPAPAMTPPSPPGNEPADSRAQAAFDARRDSRR